MGKIRRADRGWRVERNRGVSGAGECRLEGRQKGDNDNQERAVG